MSDVPRLVEDLAPGGRFGPPGGMAATMAQAIPEGPWMYLPCDVRGLPTAPREWHPGWLIPVMAGSAGLALGGLWGEGLIFAAGLLLLGVGSLGHAFSGWLAACWRWMLGQAGEVSWRSGWLVATNGADLRFVAWRRRGGDGAWQCRLAWSDSLDRLGDLGPMRSGRFFLDAGLRRPVSVGPLPAGHPLMALVTCRKGCLMGVMDLWALLEALREKVAQVPFDIGAPVPFHTRRR